MITCLYSSVCRETNRGPFDRIAFLHNWEIRPRCLLKVQFQFLRRFLFRGAVHNRVVGFSGFR